MCGQCEALTCKDDADLGLISQLCQAVGHVKSHVVWSRHRRLFQIVKIINANMGCNADFYFFKGSIY